MMKELSGQHLDRDDKVITVVDHFLEVQDTEKTQKTDLFAPWPLEYVCKSRRGQF